MKTKIKQLMSRHVVVASSEHKYSQVSEFFARFAVHHIPVTEGDKVIGIISAKDIIKSFYNYMKQHGFCVNQEELDNELSLTGIMTPNPMTIHPEDDLDKAARIFSENRFHCLPVVDDGKVVGIITTKDIAKEVLMRK